MENTNKHNRTDSMEIAVLEKIRTDELSMHSKTYFYARVVFAVVVAAVVFCVSAFLFGFIIFMLLASGRSLLLGFGGRGILFFFETFPWLIFVGDIILIFLLERLLRQFKFAYRSPMVYLLGGLIILSAVAGYSLTKVTSFSPYAQPAQGNGPSMGVFNTARRAPRPDNGVCRCTITAIDGSELSVIDTENNDQPLTVVLPQDNSHVHSDGLVVGEKVFIAGDIRDGILYAFGLHPVAPTEPAFPQPM